MQARMKKYPLSENQITNLLDTELVGHLATIGADGFPYVTPIHFVFMEGKIYTHGLAVGEKLENIERCPSVGFEVAKMISFIQDPEKPCGTNTVYESVIIRGTAAILENTDQKIAAFDATIAKYTPQHIGKTYPANMMKMTSVVEITVQSCTGKHYPAQGE